MSGKKKKSKNSSNIIVAIIGLVGTIITVVGAIAIAFIGKQNDYNINKISKNDSFYSEGFIDIITLKDNLNKVLEKSKNDSNGNINTAKNEIDKSEVNSVNIFGDNSGTVSIVNNDSSKGVTLTGEISKSIVYGENNEIVDIYYDDTSIPICNLQMSNGNNDAINIKNIFVEVTNCNIFNKVVDNIIHNGWATMEKKIFWSCNISPEYKRYQSILLGYDENNINDLSKTNYVNMASHDTGQFELVIYPDTPGEYKINVIVEYIINGKVIEAVLPNIEFTYNPNTEYTIEPALDVIEDIGFSE